MADRRKLQGEIERCLKKVSEGVETFEDIWKKVYSATNTNQKEKYEADLKKEIKRLQRLRDQIKTWLSSSDIKDKRQLQETRKLIETQMERFKVVERETKTKAYSKEGLSGGLQKIDPIQKEKDEANQWLVGCIDALNIQVDQFECELESMSAQTKKAKNLTSKDTSRVEELRAHLEKHRYHINKLETLMRMLDNGTIEADKIRSVQDDVNYYIESCLDPDFEANDYLYDDLRLDESCAPLGVGEPLLLKSSTTSSQSNATSEHGSESPPHHEMCSVSANSPGNATSSHQQHLSSVPHSATAGTLPAGHHSHAHTPNHSAHQTQQQQSQQHQQTNSSHHSNHSSNKANSEACSASSLSGNSTGSVVQSGLGASTPNTSNSSPAPSSDTGNLKVSHGGRPLSPLSSAGGLGLPPGQVVKPVALRMPASTPASTSATAKLQHHQPQQPARQVSSSPSPALNDASKVAYSSVLATPAPPSHSPHSQASAHILTHHQQQQSQQPPQHQPAALQQQAQVAVMQAQLAKQQHIHATTGVAPQQMNGIASPTTSIGSNSSSGCREQPHPVLNGPVPQQSTIGSPTKQQQPHVTDNIHAGSLSINNSGRHPVASPAISVLQQHPRPQHQLTSTPDAQQPQVQQPQQMNGVCDALPPLSPPHMHHHHHHHHHNHHHHQPQQILHSNLAQQQQQTQNQQIVPPSHEDPAVASAAAGGSGDVLIPPSLGVAPLGRWPMAKECFYQLHQLSWAAQHLPHPSDSDRLRSYIVRQPCTTPPYYPLSAPHQDPQEIFQRLTTDTLFFIFYYMEGTKAQYLAAKALKKQSWRFHTKFMMWFQRHEEPKTITDEFEQGTYIYFDYERWSQRRKEGFTFEYRFLEDRELN